MPIELLFISYIAFVSLGFICMLVFMFVVFRKFKNFKHNLNLHELFFADEHKKLRKKIEHFERIQVQMGQNILHQEDKVETWSERITRIEVRESQFASYHHAAKLVELGANQDEIAQTCGLSRAEAELVVMVNRQNKTSASPSTEAQNLLKPYDYHS